MLGSATVAKEEDKTQINVEEVQGLLYVLTGQKPLVLDKTITDNVKGLHMRFPFAFRGKEYNQTKLVFKILDITAHEIFSPDMLKYCLNIAASEFKKIPPLFNPLVTIDFTIQMDNLSNEERLSLFNMLFSLKEEAALVDRFEETFPESPFKLDGIMLHYARLIMSKASSFTHLKERGHEFSHEIVLSVSESDEEELAPAKAFTPSYNRKDVDSAPQEFKVPLPPAKRKGPHK